MKVKYLNTAKKSIKAMDHQNRTRVEKALEMLPEGDILPMYYEHTYRLRVGKYRIIFAYDGNNNASKGEEIVCYEDILVDILEHGDKLTVYDREEDKDHELTLEKLLAGFKKYAEDVYRKGSIGLDDMDAIVADQILQMAIFGELTYS